MVPPQPHPHGIFRFSYKTQTFVSCLQSPHQTELLERQDNDSFLFIALFPALRLADTLRTVQGTHIKSIYYVLLIKALISV